MLTSYTSQRTSEAIVLPNALTEHIGLIIFVKRQLENRTAVIRHGVEQTRA